MPAGLRPLSPPFPSPLSTGKLPHSNFLTFLAGAAAYQSSTSATRRITAEFFYAPQRVHLILDQHTQREISIKERKHAAFSTQRWRTLPWTLSRSSRGWKGARKASPPPQRETHRWETRGRTDPLSRWGQPPCQGRHHTDAGLPPEGCVTLRPCPLKWKRRERWPLLTPSDPFCKGWEGKTLQRQSAWTVRFWAGTLEVKNLATLPTAHLDRQPGRKVFVCSSGDVDPTRGI